MTVNNLIDGFLEMMAAERASAENTLAAYQRDLEAFHVFILSQNTTLEKAITDTVKQYLAHLTKIGQSPRSQARKLSAIRQFYTFLHTEGIRADNPTALLDSPKLGASLPKYLSPEEVDYLLQVVHQEKNPKALRLTALVEMLYASGMRVSELLTLKITNIQQDIVNKSIKPFIIIQGKGNKERLVPLNLPAIDALSAYLKIRGEFLKQGTESEWLFPAYAKTRHNIHLTRQHLCNLLKDLAIRANIAPERLSPHVLRHSFASHLVNNGADLRIVQELLGHASISTTQIYTHILNERMKTLVLDHHPLAVKNDA